MKVFKKPRRDRIIPELTPGRTNESSNSESGAEGAVGGRTSQLEASARSDNGQALKPALKTRDLEPAAPEATGMLNAQGERRSSTVTIGYPAQFPWSCPRCPGRCNDYRDIEKHLKTHDFGVNFRCSKEGCKKQDTVWKYHSITIHFAKCVAKQVKETIPTDLFPCEGCTRVFSTQRGLSTHRRIHPKLANEWREGASERGNKQRREKRTREGSKGDPPAVSGTEEALDDVTQPMPVLQHTSFPEIVEEITDQIPSQTTWAHYGPTVEQIMAGVKENYLKVNDDWRMLLTSLARSDANQPMEEWVQIEVACENILGGIERDAPKRNLGKENELPKKSRGEYRRAQQLYHNNPSKLAREILDGKQKRCRIPIATVQGEFEKKLGTSEQLNILEGKWPIPPEANCTELLITITPKDVLGKLNRLKPSSAGGPDGVRKRHLLGFDRFGVKLAILYNVWLRYKKIPRSTKECRSILIPKTSQRLDELSNWRPITIGSIVSRMYASLLEKRLRNAISLSARQRGFISSPGCEENLAMLDLAIRRSKKRNNALSAFIALDLAKAFDTVSHDLIRKGLSGMKVDEGFLAIIDDMYTNATTRFESDGCLTDPIKILQGVKQGDPLSSTLFNICLNPLLLELEQTNLGIEISENITLTVQGFADDLFVMSKSIGAAKVLLEICHRFSKETGLLFNVGKCASFVVKTEGKSWTVENRNLYLKKRGEPRSEMTLIPRLGSTDTTKYLGMEVGPWSGVGCAGKALSELRRLAGTIKSAPLKPTQRVTILVRNAIPRVLYGLQGPRIPSQNELEEIDGWIRSEVKEHLKLPKCTTNGLLYSRLADGGLGVPYLSRMLPRIHVGRLRRLVGHSDGLIRGASRENGMVEKLVKLRSVIERQGGKDYRKVEYEKWEKLEGPQGFGVSSYRGSKLSHQWILPHSLFKEYEKISILQMRANVWPTREALLRGGRIGNSACRLCGNQLESLHHVLCSCPCTQGLRILRHNRILDWIERALLKRGYGVSREPTFNSPTGKLKPDLVIVNPSKTAVWVLDPSVVAEDRLGITYNLKKSKYQWLTLALAVEYAGAKVRVHGLPVSVRGIIPDVTLSILADLGIPKGEASRSISTRALSGSLAILRRFR